VKLFSVVQAVGAKRSPGPFVSVIDRKISQSDTGGGLDGLRTGQRQEKTLADTFSPVPTGEVAAVVS
jgi:hypothetical protein